ncbi:MAG: alpha/beta fold hydrolase, partial [Planctomycetota bacterium]|nr:alpha/beta fold hydrolase [Planctomycetota bacterium]
KRPKQFGEPIFLDSGDSGFSGISESRGRPGYPGGPGRPGVVLVHGYLGCPEQVRPLAEYLHSHGYNVYCVRLAGHGTSSSQLPHVTWADWMDSVMHGYAVMKQHCDRVVVAGFSLGGMLALLAAARLGQDIDGAICINTPVRLRDKRMPLVPAMVRFSRVMRRVGLRKGYAFWRHTTESPGINYDHNYLVGVSEVRRAMAAGRREIRRIECPVQVVQAEDDPLIAPSSGKTLLAELTCDEKVLTELSFNRHMIIRGPGSELVFAKMLSFLGRNRTQHAASENRIAPEPGAIRFRVDSLHAESNDQSK